MTDALRKDYSIEAEPTLAEGHPQVFARAIVTPPAPPWEQVRVATLDARHGAPVPISELIHRVKRLSGWAPGRPGRFAVFYVRAKEFRTPFETSVDVDGQLVKVAFGLGGEQVRRARDGAMVLLWFVVLGALVGAGVTLAFGARAQAARRLEAAEKLGAAKLAAAQAYRRQVAQARELRTVLGRARPVGDVIGDLTWVATSKTPEARIAAVHWQGEGMAIEARGDQPPFEATDRHIERAPHPLRPGVSLWGIGPRQDLTRSSQPASRTSP
ncbi:hypothetical protein [Phenylobacterium sp.]|uniref:hypothetical protein n=1 Tax=Phenylobacterium sp. TaxID=1871053 RepID=UPI002E338F52|nr:hypothetical protein [Phenylobacterium sp.]HEX4712063.1 hypothetical protein [Phenylobacterium sp.]